MFYPWLLATVMDIGCLPGIVAVVGEFSYVTLLFYLLFLFALSEVIATSSRLFIT